MFTLRVGCRLLLVTSLVHGANAQLRDGPVEFEAASIRPAGAPVRVPVEGGGYSVYTGSRGGPGSRDPGHFTGASISLFDLIKEAYRVQSFQISGPAWIKTTLFDLTAKVPTGATKAQLALMLQALLAERFQLVLHKETKEMSGYELTVGKNGHKLREATNTAVPADGDASPDLRKLKVNADGYLPVIRTAPGTYSGGSAGGHITNYMAAFTMEQLARLLSSRLGRLVGDHTGLTGQYDFELHYVEATGPDGEGGPTLASAVPAQLGLRLEAKKVMAEILVVDSADKIPTGN